MGLQVQGYTTERGAGLECDRELPWQDSELGFFHRIPLKLTSLLVLRNLHVH